MIFKKKGINSIVATSLLLVVAVIAVVGFGNFFESFQSKIQTNVESDSNKISSLEIDLISDGKLFLNNKDKKETLIENIVVNGLDCNIISQNVTNIGSIDLSKCLKNNQNQKVNLLIKTSNGIIKENVYIGHINFDLCGNATQIEQVDKPTENLCSDDVISSVVNDSNLRYFTWECKSDLETKKCKAIKKFPIMKVIKSEIFSIEKYNNKIYYLKYNETNNNYYLNELLENGSSREITNEYFSLSWTTNMKTFNDKLYLTLDDKTNTKQLFSMNQSEEVSKFENTKIKDTPRDFYVYKNKLYFNAATYNYLEQELYSIDDNDLLTEILETRGRDYMFPLLDFDNKLYFTIGGQLHYMQNNGSIKKIYYKNESQDYEIVSIKFLTEFNDKLYFYGYNHNFPMNPYRLHSIDKNDNVKLFKYTYPAYLTKYKNNIYFKNDNGLMKIDDNGAVTNSGFKNKDNKLFSDVRGMINYKDYLIIVERIGYDYNFYSYDGNNVEFLYKKEYKEAWFEIKNIDDILFFRDGR